MVHAFPLAFRSWAAAYEAGVSLRTVGVEQVGLGHVHTDGHMAAEPGRSHAGRHRDDQGAVALQLQVGQRALAEELDQLNAAAQRARWGRRGSTTPSTSTPPTSPMPTRLAISTL